MCFISYTKSLKIGTFHNDIGSQSSFFSIFSNPRLPKGESSSEKGSDETDVATVKVGIFKRSVSYLGWLTAELR